MSGVVASTGVAYNQRQGRTRWWKVGVERVAKRLNANAEVHKSVANMFDGKGSGSTEMLKRVDCLRNVMQATIRQRERCAQALYTKVVALPLMERIVIKMNAKMEVAMQRYNHVGAA
jgi:hypothetical protein